MISYLKGEIIYRGESFIVLSAGDIGYEISLPGNRAMNYAEGQKAEVCTYLYKREDALQLYGFSDWQEREMFLLLIGISGVGPKAALAILGELSKEGLYQAVINDNVTLLTKVPGIGKKTAQRLILELKDKIGQKFADLKAYPEAEIPPERHEELLGATIKEQELFQALEALGYQAREIKSIYPELKPLFASMDEQSILKKALQLLLRG